MRRRDAGSAFLLVLGVLAILVTVVAGLASLQRGAFQNLILERETREAQILAEAGLQRALAELTLPTQNPGATTLQDPWAVLGDGARQRFLVGAGSFRVQIVDSGSLVDLNAAPEAQLQRLPLTQEQVDSLLDWRTDNRDPRPEGAKDEFYNNLTNPYNTALRPLRSLDELLLIRGFTGATLTTLPEDLNTNQLLVSGALEDQPVLLELVSLDSAAGTTNAQGQPKLNVNTAQVGQMIGRGIEPGLAGAIVLRRNQVGTFTNMGAVLQVPGVTLQNAGQILDNLQVGNAQEVAGRINLNTAEEAVLNSLPGMTPDVAQAILSRQSVGFTGLGELAEIPGVTVPLLQQIADSVSISSRRFLVRVEGQFGQATYTLEASVSVVDGVPRLLRRGEPLSPRARDLWRWDTEATNDVDLGATR